MANMTNGAYHATTNPGAVGAFIPEIWSDEVIATYKSNLVAANLVRNLNHAGKKGDSIHIPTPGRSSAAAKAINTDVTAQTDHAGTETVTIDKHYEYSMYIEDFAEMQALNSMRKFYTDDAGFALAKQVDTSIITDLDGASALTGGNSVITGVTDWDASILAAIEVLNDSNVPVDGRSLMVTPSCMTALMSTHRFTEQQFIGDGNAIKTGLIGSIYGIEVFMSTQVGTGSTEKAFMFQKEAVVLATQQSIRTQTQYKQEKLADLFTADTIYGSKVVRPGSIQELTS
jgi:N4-gp56 family major capsid protein